MVAEESQIYKWFTNRYVYQYFDMAITCAYLSHFGDLKLKFGVHGFVCTTTYSTEGDFNP